MMLDKASRATAQYEQASNVVARLRAARLNSAQVKIRGILQQWQAACLMRVWALFKRHCASDRLAQATASILASDSALAVLRQEKQASALRWLEAMLLRLQAREVACSSHTHA